MLRDERLDEATKLAVAEQLEALADSDLSEKDQVRLWKSIKKRAPGLVDRGSDLIQDLATAYVKQQLGL